MPFRSAREQPQPQPVESFPSRQRLDPRPPPARTKAHTLAAATIRASHRQMHQADGFCIAAATGPGHARDRQGPIRPGGATRSFRHGLRDRVKVIAAGKLITPAEVAWAYCAGADFVTSARGFMFALGCIQAMKCNKNTCPTGIITHDKRLQRGLDPQDKAVRVKKFVDGIRTGVGTIAHSCGVPNARALKRFHCRIVQDTGRSVPMDVLHPPVEVLEEYRDRTPA